MTSYLLVLLTRSQLRTSGSLFVFYLINIYFSSCRLLLNGVGDINVTTLIGYTSFNDESGESQDRLVTFKRWLWAVIEKMAPLEKQVNYDLICFAFKAL